MGISLDTLAPVPRVQVRHTELTACADDLAMGARRVAEAASAFDRRADVGAELGHPVAAEAYEHFFADWSLRLHECVVACDAGARAVREAAQAYAQWERFVGDLSR